MHQLSARQRAKYPSDLYASLQSLAQRGAPIGIAAEVSQDIQRMSGTAFAPAANSLFVSLGELNEMSRTLTATGSATSAGLLVPIDQGEIDPVLRAASVIGRAGAVFLTGLQGALSIPRETAETSFEWLHETDQLVEPDTAAFGSVNLAPHRCTAAVTLSSQLSAQAGFVLTKFLTASLIAGAGAALERAALNGSGVAGEPAGVYATAGVSTVTFGGAATLAKVLEMEGTLAAANADDANITFLGNPDTRKKWRSIAALTSANAIWNLEEDKVLSHPGHVTTAMPATGIMAGDFSKMIVGLWGEGTPMQLIVDPFSLSLGGKIRFVATILADVGLLKPQSFIINSDSAVQ